MISLSVSMFTHQRLAIERCGRVSPVREGSDPSEPADFQAHLPLTHNILCFDRGAIHTLLFTAVARASLSTGR
jgi:hypothetical protein